MTENELQDFAGEIRVGRGRRPLWLTRLGYGLVFLGLLYFIGTVGQGGLAGPNWVFWVALAIWLVYTPIAARKKWFAIDL